MKEEMKDPANFIEQSHSLNSQFFKTWLSESGAVPAGVLGAHLVSCGLRESGSR